MGCEKSGGKITISPRVEIGFDRILGFMRRGLIFQRVLIWVMEFSTLGLDPQYGVGNSSCDGPLVTLG